MAIRPFLAMTGAEMRNSPGISQGICWMACHFSPYATRLSNLPPGLPPGNLLMVDDITPIHGHRADVIAAQLEDAVKRLGCTGILLDFQRPDSEDTAALAAHLVKALPCPVAVSDVYARNLDCPVFLSAPACHEPPEDCFTPWQGREIWLELSKSPELITITAQGARIDPLPCLDADGAGFREDRLHCHYKTDIAEASAAFTLWRSREDLDALLQTGEKYGVTTAVGLYQELR